MDRGAWCLVGDSSWDHKESDTTKQLRHAHTLYYGHTCLAPLPCKISSILTLYLPVSIRKDAFFYAIAISLPTKATCVRVCLKPKQENQTHRGSRIQALALSQAMYMFLGNPYCFHTQWNDTFPIKKNPKHTDININTDIFFFWSQFLQLPLLFLDPTVTKNIKYIAVVDLTWTN